MHLYEIKIAPRKPKPQDEGMVFTVMFPATDKRMAQRRAETYFSPQFIPLSEPKRV